MDLLSGLFNTWYSIGKGDKNVITNPECYLPGGVKMSESSSTSEENIETGQNVAAAVTAAIAGTSNTSVNAPPSPLGVAPTMGMLIRRSLDSKLLPFAMTATAASCESGSTPASPSSPAPSSSSSDKTDNHDTFGFFANAADMRREEDRLKTFEKWPVPFLKPETLARNGFYYLGRGDEVRCAFCKVEIMRWVEGDDPALDHQRWAPQCTFLRRQAASGNVPLESPDSTGRDECGVHIPPTTNAVRMPGPVHQKYASEAARLRSFKDWPRCMPQKPEDLAEAGFFYTGQGDKTKCFYCDGGLRDWEPEDVPWEQHARWFDRCAYVQLVKGREYVQKVIAEASGQTEKKESAPAPPAAAPVPEPVTETEEEKEKESTVEEAKLCKICYVEERNVCFVPCGHVVACTKCALSTNKCPMCRRTFQNAVRLYFS